MNTLHINIHHTPGKIGYSLREYAVQCPNREENVDDWDLPSCRGLPRNWAASMTARIGKELIEACARLGYRNTCIFAMSLWLNVSDYQLNLTSQAHELNHTLNYRGFSLVTESGPCPWSPPPPRRTLAQESRIFSSRREQILFTTTN